MAFLIDAYTEDEAPNTKGGVDKRVVLKLDPRLAPVKVAVLPLSRNADLSPKAKDLAAELRENWNVDFDDSGAIGRRYRRQDEIGTPYCVTVDFETLDDDAVTVRERDTMSQERVGLDGISALVRREAASAADARAGGPCAGWRRAVHVAHAPHGRPGHVADALSLAACSTAEPRPAATAPGRRRRGGPRSRSAAPPRPGPSLALRRRRPRSCGSPRPT